MKTATVRDLRTAFPRVESWLSEGESIIITKAGKPIAQLTPPPVVAKPDFARRFRTASKRSSPASTINTMAILSDERGE